VLNSDAYCDKAPAEVYAMLLDSGNYLCSVRTMYRILSRLGQNTIRYHAQPRLHPAPELVATRPNQVWTWDITKLKGPRSWSFYYLYVILDMFSRYVVGWLVAEAERAWLAKELIKACCEEQGIEPGQLISHSDNGKPMTAKLTVQLLADLGITKSLSRPYCSNDNPYSEAAFKTLKYRPGLPDRFYSLEEARMHCRPLLTWYNTEHRHSGIAMLTPQMVHYGFHQPVLDNRARVLQQAFELHPERFVGGVPKVEQLRPEVWINKPKESKSIIVVP
jgi:putative transposase